MSHADHIGAIPAANDAAAATPARILDVAFGCFASKVLLTAVEFGVFTALSEQDMTGEDLGKALGLHPRGIYDFLDSLVSMGFLQRQGGGAAGRYRNSFETALFLDRKQPAYVGGALEMMNARQYGFWNDLGTALKTGEPQSEIKHSGKGAFETMYADQAKLEQFMACMEGVSRLPFERLADTYDFSRYQSVCDVGGATGLLSTILAGRHRHLRCVSFDLPEVEPIAKRWIARAGLSDRVSTAAGNFLTQPLPRADVITMGMILHDWSLEKKKHLVKLAYDALPPGGVFIAIEHLIDDDRRTNTFALLMSLNMMIELGEGFDFSGADFWSWCQEAGFSRYEVLPLTEARYAAIAYK